jgi:heme oxygenase (mycobilin-producing)
MLLTRINEFQAAPGKAEELYIFLQSLVPFISSSVGCSGCEVLRNCDQADAFVVIERWDSKAAHQASLAGFPKEDMQAAMALFGAAPKGNYFQAD